MVCACLTATDNKEIAINKLLAYTTQTRIPGPYERLVVDVVGSLKRSYYICLLSLPIFVCVCGACVSDYSMRLMDSFVILCEQWQPLPLHI